MQKENEAHKINLQAFISPYNFYKNNVRFNGFNRKSKTVPQKKNEP